MPLLNNVYINCVNSGILSNTYIQISMQSHIKKNMHKVCKFHNSVRYYILPTLHTVHNVLAHPGFLFFVLQME